MIRLSSGIGLREMARTVGVDPATILKWERAEHRPSGEAAVRWADELSKLVERKRPRRKAS